MKAAVCYKFGKPLVIEEVEIDSPLPGEVMVRVAATGICHSDLHLIKGEWGGPTPMVPGHEVAGVVEEIGDNVATVKKGDPVVVCLVRNCGRCHYCTKGLPQMCSGDFDRGRPSHLRNSRGDFLAPGLFTAGFAEYVVVDQSQVVPVPEGFSLQRAALLACGVVTGVGAVVNTAEVETGSSVAVIGAGGVGLNSLQGAALAGAYPIVAIDLLTDKLDTAREFGATHCLQVGQGDLEQEVRNITHGRGVDYAFVTVGTVKAIEQAIELVGKRGTVVIVGLPPVTTKVSFSVLPLVRSEKRIIGSRMGSTRLGVDVPRLVDLHNCGRLKLEELITARYPLEQINEAIELMENGRALRNLIVFDQ